MHNYETELLYEWITELEQKREEYLEPILDSDTMSLIKLACIVLRQDIHVFIMSVDLLERYLQKKDLKDEIICEFTLTVAVIIFISSKYMGEQDLKLHHLESFLKKMTGKTYNIGSIRFCEMEILATLENKIPVTCIVDDVNAFVTKYETEYKLKVSIRQLCLDILELLYLTRNKWFFDIKNFYNQNEEAFKVFKSLMSSKFYLPVGILLYSFLYTNYQYSINIEAIIEDLSNKLNIHPDHINLLISKIHQICSLK